MLGFTTMIAVKKQIQIPSSRRIEVELPPDTPEGIAEVIVLVPEPRTASSLTPAVGVLQAAAVLPVNEEDEQAVDALMRRQYARKTARPLGKKQLPTGG
jgi:hypothetical protein